MNAPGYDVFATDCPSRETFELVTSKWGTLALVALHRLEAPRRFAELRRQIGGISEKMLSQTLKQLQAQGLITRTVRATLPAVVEYDLTAAGRTVAETLTALVDTVYSVQPSLPVGGAGYDA